MYSRAFAIISAAFLCVLLLLCAAGCGQYREASASSSAEISAPATAEAAVTTEPAAKSERSQQETTQTTSAAETGTIPSASTVPTAITDTCAAAAESEVTANAVTVTSALQTTTVPTAASLTAAAPQTTAETVPPAEPTLSASDLEEAAGEAVTKLMIVAHPDDETIWGGAHLLEGGYLVLCITNGDNVVRAAEFQKAVRQSGNIPLILQYPDKTAGVRDSWKGCMENIRADIRFVLSAKHWELIATHNPSGEYGHVHHRLVSRLTAEEYESLSCAAQLCFFGTYHTRAEIESAPEAFPALPDDTLCEKQTLCRIYASQSAPLFSFAHMLPYENWTEYAP